VPEKCTDKTLICPQCLADVVNPYPGFQVRVADINTDVKRDLNVGNIVLLVLTGLCVLGLATAAFRFRFYGQIDAVTTFVGFSAALGLLLIIAIIRGMVRSISAGRIGPYVPIIAGTLTITLIIMTFVLVTIVAGFVFFLAACGKMLGH
jgi:hypothetical protein